MQPRTLIIAEAGVNHNGSLSLAKELADAAARAGADMVKYQIFDPRALAVSNADVAEYQKRCLEGSDDQVSMLSRLQLPLEDFIALKEYCNGIGIEFWATAFDDASLSFLVDVLHPRMLKIPSGELNNYPFLLRVAETGLPVIMSCGMATADEVAASLGVLAEHSAGEVTLLHCNTQYPTPYADVNLLAMKELGRKFNVPYGYSDHTAGIEVPLAAVALGASVIEKHFTLDRTMDGPDHAASLEPTELCSMVESIRNIEQALGSSEKVVTDSERANRAVARKSIVAASNIKCGDLLTEANLTTKRPGTGIDPMRWGEVIGTRAIRDFSADELIEL